MQVSGNSQCPIQVHKLRHPIRFVYSLYCYSISVALQALTVISMGVVADHRKNIYQGLFNRY